MKPAKKYKIPTEERLTRQAVFYLERYATSVENLRRVLERKVARAARSNDLNERDFSELIDAVIAKCERSGMVDDRNYAETKVSNQRLRGYSSRQIAAKLMSKGVRSEVVDQALSGHGIDDRHAAILMAKRKRIGPWRTRGNREAYRDKDMAALCRAGFAFEIARKIIDGDADELIDAMDRD